MANSPAKTPLILSPTPLHRLDRLSEDLGIDLWIKRDDLTGFAFGGNKGRKLEYLISEALKVGATVVVTCGSAQSNFVRQLGAACSMNGLRCAAVVMDLPYDAPAGKPSGAHPGGTGGNVLLDSLLGVDLRVIHDGDWDSLFVSTEDLAIEWESAGETVYRIPVGGSSPLGAYAFYQAASELNVGPFDWLVCASSSGSTQTGLAYAFAGSATQVLGVACDPEPNIALDFAEIGRGLAPLIGASKFLEAEDYLLDFSAVGEGYGIVTDEGSHAIQLMARREGIFLDPVYTAKAFACLIRRAETRDIEGRVLFWHTGGTPALFA